MMRRIFVISAATAISVGVWWSVASAGVGHATTVPSDASAAKARADRLLRTEDFESGGMQLSQASAPQLEDFLRDLNRRKDFDFSAHGGQAGPNADYLADWVTRVTNELIARGYWYDARGDLHDGDGHVIAVR